MKYNTAYHLHCDIELDSGLSISLEYLQQEKTYTGLFECLPRKSTNDNNVERATKRARLICLSDSEPLLIEPQRRNFLREPGDMNDVPTVGFFRSHPEWLPMVSCIGEFKSTFPVGNAEEGNSHLVIVWYQEKFGPPIEDDIMKKIKAIDWDSKATNYEL